MMKTDRPLRQPKSSSSRSAGGESIGDVAQMTYEFMNDESSVATTQAAAAVIRSTAKPLPAPKIKQNLAYGKVKLPEAEQN